MKSNYIKIGLIVFLVFAGLTSFTSISNQERSTLIGIYDGHEDYGYNFIYLDANKDERTMTFQEIDEAVLDQYDLDSEDMLAAKFEITYTTSYETEIDEDGTEYENEINTITALKPL